jgi:hypothetical protein
LLWVCGLLVQGEGAFAEPKGGRSSASFHHSIID